MQVTSADGGSEAGTVLDERFDAGALHLLRERVAACAAAAGMRADRAMEVTLAVHELAANAVRRGAAAGPRGRRRAALPGQRCRPGRGPLAGAARARPVDRAGGRRPVLGVF